MTQLSPNMQIEWQFKNTTTDSTHPDGFEWCINAPAIDVSGKVIMPGLVILLQAAVAALVNAGIDDAWAALIVGGGIVVIGLILLMVGMSRLKARQLVPNRTIEQVQRDASVAKQQVRKDDDSLQRAA